MAPAKKTTDAVATETATDATPAKETERQLRARLKAEATRNVIEAHRQEYDQIAEQLHRQAGIEYKRRLNEDEKAEAELQKLLAKNPALKAKLTNYVEDGTDEFGTEPAVETA